MTKPVVTWLGQTNRCDLCHKPFGLFLYDAKLMSGVWATICDPCFSVSGRGLGTGLGQKYICRAEGRFMKVEG